MARQEIEAQNHWKVAEHLLRSHVNGMQGHLPHALRSFVQHTDTENYAHRVQETPKVLLKAQNYQKLRCLRVKAQMRYLKLLQLR